MQEQSTTPRVFYGLWWNTAVPHALTRTRAIGFGITVATGAIAWLVPALEPYRAIATWAVPLTILVVYGVYRLIRAPYQIHRQQEQTLALAKAETTHLREQLTDYQNHQGLADELTHWCEWATHELLNKAPANGRMPDDHWFRYALEWRDTVLEVLTKHKCTKQEINHFDTINGYDLGKFRGVHQDVAMIFVRVERAGAIATDHAKKVETLKLRPSQN